MEVALPPARDAERLVLELRLAPHTEREDAIQEAWVAFLSGNDPVRAVNTFVRRQRRLRRRREGAVVA